MATLHPTKSTTPVPERTEEDNQRLFQLYKGWTLTERDGQVRQWVYQFGYDIQHAQKGERRWVCCLCIKQKRPRPKSYAIKGFFFESSLLSVCSYLAMTDIMTNLALMRAYSFQARRVQIQKFHRSTCCPCTACSVNLAKGKLCFP